MPDLGSLTSMHDRYACALGVLGSVSFKDYLCRWFFSFSFLHPLNLHGLKNGILGFRARQLFYYLKGGQVDYGEEHSKAYGHSQFGRVYEQGSVTYMS